MNENLIYGKDRTKNIVSIEVYEDDQLEIITETEGKIESTFQPYVYWLICSKPQSGKYYTLEGNLHYKYAYTFTDKSEFFKFRKYLRSKNADFYSVSDPKEAIMLRDGYTYFKGMEMQNVSILSFDIETTGLNHNEDSKILLISNTYRSASGQIIRKLFCYDDYGDPGAMLECWTKWVREMNPSIITGHNILSFDLPYMQYIADKHDSVLNLGRDGSSIKFNDYTSKFRKDGSQFYEYKKVQVYGREVVDTLFLSIRYDATERKFVSYGLKNIIKQLGYEDPNRQFYDAGQIRFKYKDPEEWEKIKKYCEHDADDALKVFDLAAPPTFYFTQSIPKSFQAMTETATGSQLNSLLVRSYLQEKHSIPKGDDAEAFEGAISWGNPGVFRNVKKWDIASLYPSIILQYEIYSKEKDPKANFLKMVETFRSERLKNKKLAKDTGLRYYDDMQASQKIGINSAYGLLGAPGLHFNFKEGAARITEIGREILKKAIKWSTGKEYEDWTKEN